MMRKILGGLGLFTAGAVAVVLGASTLSTGCGSSGGSDGGTNSNSSSSSSSSSSSGGSSGAAAPETFCDGFGLKDSSSNLFLVETFNFSAQLGYKTSIGGCYNALVGYTDDAGFSGLVDGDTVQAISGILDVDQEFYGKTEGQGATATAAADPALFLAGCDDVGVYDAGPLDIDGDGGMNFTLPTAAQTVASVVSAQKVATSGPLVGVVTAVYPWTPAAGTEAAKSGNFYIQDPVAPGGTPAAGSGALVYVSKDDINSTMTIPNRGDVVSITGLSWSPYNGADKDDNLPGYTNEQVELETGSATAIAVIGNAPLPPPIQLTAADLSPTGTSEKQYYQMRVSVTPGPFTVAGTGQYSGSSPNFDCPAQLTTVIPASGD
jgi:hypothetical protein